MAPRTARFLFDFISPFAYFGWIRMRALEERYACEVQYEPVLYAGLLDHWGLLGPAELPPKRTFILSHCLRFASRHGIPFRGPKAHPFNSLTALRVSLPEVAGDDQLRVISTLWTAIWAEGIDGASKSEIVRVLDGAGLDGTSLVQRTAEHRDLRRRAVLGKRQPRRRRGDPSGQEPDRSRPPR
jgi:2-hydroxychromene-2-carboxylate isomerase